MPELRIDDLMINGLKLTQDKELFCFGTDAVLLANFASPKKGASVLDIGTGNGIIPVLLTAKTDAASITGLEIQHKSASLAQKNVELNQLEDRVHIVQGDIKDESLFSPSTFDYITCNPPYKQAGTGLQNPASPLAIARHEVACTLEDIIKAASRLLKPKGRLAMVHKPERLADLIDWMRRFRIEPKRIQTVHSSAGLPPSLLLIEGLKDGGTEIRFLPPLTIYDEQGNYTASIKELYQKGKESSYGT